MNQHAERLREEAETMFQSIHEDVNTDPVTEPAQVEDVVEQNTEEAQPQEQPEVQTEDIEIQQDTVASVDVDWQKRCQAAEHRYQVLQGKYNKEIAEVKQSNSQEVDVLRTEIARLTEVIDALSKNAAQPQAQAQTPVNTATEQSLVEKQIRGEYGDELPDYINERISRIEQSQAQQPAPRDDAEMQQQLQKMREQAAQEAHAAKVAILSQALTQHSISFEAVDKDPLFSEWLNKYDPDTGVQRGAELHQAFREGRVEHCVKIYRAFVDQSIPQPQSPQPDFQQHVQPRATAPAQEQVPEQVPVVTGEEINAFYEKARRGHYTPEEKARLEAELFASLGRQQYV